MLRASGAPAQRVVTARVCEVHSGAGEVRPSGHRPNHQPSCSHLPTPCPTQALSTRIYRGQMPESATDAGIAFLAFGGTALVRRVSCYEMGSAWEHPAVAAAVSPKVAAAAAPSPKQAAVLAAAAAAAAAGGRGGSAAASPAAKAANGAVRLEPAGAEEEAGPLRGASPAAATAAAAAADALLDEMVMLSPQCSAAVVGAFA